MKKSLIIIISLVLIYLIAFTIIFGSYDTFTNKYIYIDNNVSWKYSNKKWENVDIKNETILKGYNIYLPNTYELYGKYTLKYSENNWYIKNKKNFELYGNTLFALKGKKMKFYNFKIERTIDKTTIDKILKEINISNYKNLNLQKKIIIDLDNDGNNEIIYALSNIYSSDIENIYFNVIALFKDNKYTIIKSIINPDNELSDIFAFVDVDGDSILELIIVDEGFSSSENIYTMYKYENNKFVKLISN